VTSPDGVAIAIESPQDLAARLAAHDYLVDEALAMTTFLALRMRRPLFLEGAPGVGKTLLARTLAEVCGAPLIRLQCYEGLDLAQAAYEWNYPRQLLALQARGEAASAAGDVAALYREDFLLRRPLLQAIDAAADRPPVLLIDELDRADDELESFLLELLGEFQITIPELGTVVARHRPIVVVTSNRTRDVHDALKRRCLYHWIDYPALATEIEIVRRRLAALEVTLDDARRAQLVAFVHRVRREELAKLPGVAETVDFAEAVGRIAAFAPSSAALAPAMVDAALGALLKDRDDVERVRGPLTARLLAESA
jgi:MoxR-like ATPase